MREATDPGGIVERSGEFDSMDEESDTGSNDSVVTATGTVSVHRVADISFIPGRFANAVFTLMALISKKQR